MKTFSISDTGMQREINEDFCFTSDNPVGNLPNLYIVADGMGGHKAGEYASRYTVERVVASISRNPQTEPVLVMTEAIHLANDMLQTESRNDETKRGMGTTIVIATIMDGILYVANIGDSRLYIIDSSKKKAKQITRDHSLVGEMVRLGEMDEKEAKAHPDKNIITRAVGAFEKVEAEFFEVDLEPDQYVLMCSDGLTNMVGDEEMAGVVSGDGSIEEKCNQLVAAANANGGSDNITVVLHKPNLDEVKSC